MPTPKAKTTPTEDVALVCGPSSDGKGLQIVRKRNETVEAAVLQPLEEGKPIAGEVLQLKRRGESPLCDVEVLLPAPPNASTRAAPITKPAQVASDAYRKNYDGIYNPARKASAARTANKKLLN